jgi:hypothetical protein
MKFTLTADQISAMIADGVAKALAASSFLPKGAHAAPSDLASKDAQMSPPLSDGASRSR